MTAEDDFTMSKTLWLEGQTASDAFRDVELHVDYVGGNIPMLCTFDTVNVTVFGVTQTGIFAGEQQPDNPKLHSSTAPKGSKDENGQISWDLPKYINLKTTTGIDYCEYFHDCMEMQGTVKPPRDANPSAYYGTAQHADDPTIPPAPPIFPAPPLGYVTFEQHREVFAAAWKKKGTGAWEVKDLPNNIPPRFWSDDWSHSNYQTTQANIVTSASHIYFIDNPGYDQKNHAGFDLDRLEYYANFRNAAFIKFYGGTFQLSDWARWHAKILLVPKDATTLKRDPNTSSQDFGGGWIDVPSNIF